MNDLLPVIWHIFDTADRAIELDRHRSRVNFVRFSFAVIGVMWSVSQITKKKQWWETSWVRAVRPRTPSRED